MLSTTIIQKPLITEKATFTSSEFNRFAFKVDKRATKPEIKRAIEELYNVRVLRVATQFRKGKVRRTRFGYREEPTFKRAIVKVHPEDRIELF